MSSAFCFLLTSVSGLIFYLILAHVILSWLITFNILNISNQFVYQLYNGLDRLLEPLLAPIRRFLPSVGGLDLSPVILIILVQFLTMLIAPTVCYGGF